MFTFSFTGILKCIQLFISISLLIRTRNPVEHLRLASSYEQQEVTRTRGEAATRAAGKERPAGQAAALAALGRAERALVALVALMEEQHPSAHYGHPEQGTEAFCDYSTTLRTGFLVMVSEVGPILLYIYIHIF